MPVDSPLSHYICRTILHTAPVCLVSGCWPQRTWHSPSITVGGRPRIGGAKFHAAGKDNTTLGALGSEQRVQHVRSILCTLLPLLMYLARSGFSDYYDGGIYLVLYTVYIFCGPTPVLYYNDKISTNKDRKLFCEFYFQ